MPNIWDIPPRPEKGDAAIEAVFEAVGRALTDWETLEECWAGVFAFMVAPHDDLSQDAPAVRAYGAIVGFTGRQGMLEAAASAYFQRNPSSTDEATFRELIGLTSRLSARRNELAHGRASWWMRDGHFLFPASYNTKKNPLRSPPLYAYTSVTIGQLRQHFRDLALRVDRWCWDMRQAAPPGY